MPLSSHRGWLFAALCLILPPLRAAPAAPLAADMDRYLAPYVLGNNFSGVVLVAKGDQLLFERAYGYAALGQRVANTPATRFHIASLSMQFTAAAVMRLVDAGKLELDMPVAKIVPGLAHGDELTVRELLTETSGLTDINGLPDYDAVLLHPQTPATLVAKIDGKPLLFTPGSKYLHEEHSAYNLLALIVERVTGLSFDAALRREVFAPLGMQGCGADDSGGVIVADLAEGYAPDGVRDLVRAPYLDWSAKTGNASVYCTAGDEFRWVQGFMHDALLSPRSRGIMLADSTSHTGYGWFTGTSKRFGGPIYYMNGRAPGYASYLVYLPEQQLTVIVLSNIYASVTTQIGADLAAIALGRPYAATPAPGSPLSADALEGMQGQFKFGADFYQPDGVLTLVTQKGDVFLKWGDGSLSPLIPVGHDHFIDRGYWEDVSLIRAADGRIVQLLYDRFQGQRISESAP
jgi:CubicO group peptidase (beta-lactamase class C family)